MRKFFFIAAFAVVSTLSMNAQGFRVGVNAGLPLGDYGDFASFNVGLDVQYLWEVSEDFNAGLTTGYSHFFGKTYTASVGDFEVEIDGGDIQFIPIAGTASYMISDQFSLGADLGYALGVNTGNDGGFYYRPNVAYGISDNAKIVLAYSGVSANNSTVNAITLGVNFGL